MFTKPVVSVTCPICNEARMVDRATKRYREKRGTFSPRCYADRLISIVKRGTSDFPDHPAVDWSRTVIVNRRTRLVVTCPKCGKDRDCHLHGVAAKVREGRFSGLCRSCCPKAKKREWKVTEGGHRIDPIKGYARIHLKQLSPEDRRLADGMRGRVTYVLEHRLVMARVLGRPLQSNELVDHMDGRKTNNDPSNLRLYVRGKNQPGETSGYGTYYDEWQRALARIRELERALAVSHVSPDSQEHEM